LIFRCTWPANDTKKTNRIHVAGRATFPPR
jgi:hypothetical protein